MSEFCPPYPKIDTLFERDPKTFKVDVGRVRRPEFEIPQRWLVTEKVDGTNVRVSLESQCSEPDGLPPETHRNVCCEEYVVRFYGRTAAAQMPTFLLDHLQRTFTLEKLQYLWRGKVDCVICGGRGHSNTVPPYFKCPCSEPYPIVLYGEGYGARIQKGGGNYRRDGDVSFRLFDVLIGGTWLRCGAVEDVARQLGIQSMPHESNVGLGGPATIEQITEFVRRGFNSIVAEDEGVESFMAEGVVAFTDPPLYNGRGQRLMFKLKTKDF